MTHPGVARELQEAAGLFPDVKWTTNVMPVFIVKRQAADTGRRRKAGKRQAGDK